MKCPKYAVVAIDAMIKAPGDKMLEKVPNSGARVGAISAANLPTAPGPIAYGLLAKTAGQRSAMKIVVNKVPTVPKTDIGANATKDFKPLRGKRVVNVTPRIQNCRVVHNAGTLLPRAMAKLDIKSPMTSA